MPGAVHGTPGFVAPEVRLGSEPNEAADVYALGAVAWFCLTGNGAPDTMIRLDHETVVSHVGAGLADVVAAAIDPEPGLRPGAAELARLFYDAVQPEPVEVVVGSDEASALTHRLRADAGRDPCVIQPPRRRWPRRLVVSAVVAAPLLAAAGWALAARGPDARPRRNPDGTCRNPDSPCRHPDGNRPGGAARTRYAAAPPAPTADGRVLRDATSPAARAEELLQALSDRRAVALVARDEAALADVHAPGSPSLASDRTLISGLRGARIRWEGLRLEVAEALFVSGSPSEAVVRARVDWTAYVVVTSSGRPRRQGRRCRASARLPPRARSAGVADQRDQRRTSHLTAPSRSGCSKVNPEASSASGSTRWLAMT